MHPGGHARAIPAARVTAFDQNLITRGRAHLSPTSASDAITVALSRPVNQGQRSAQGEPEFLPARGGGGKQTGGCSRPGTRGGFGGQRAGEQGHERRRGRPRRARRRPARPPAGGPLTLAPGHLSLAVLTWGRLSLADHLAGLFASGPEIADFDASREASAALAGCAMISKTPSGGMSSMSLMMARCCQTSGVSLRARSSRISGEPSASRYSPTPPACRRLSMPGRCCGARDPLAPIQELSRAHVRRCRLAEARGGCLSAGTSPARAAPGICPRATPASSRPGPAGLPVTPAARAGSPLRTARRAGVTTHSRLERGRCPAAEEPGRPGQRS